MRTRSSATRTIACRAACIGFLALGIGGPVLAQEGKPANEPVAPLDSDSVPREKLDEMVERNRARLHPGEPLRISGREQSGNDMRSRTPALARTDHRSARVDPQENYLRTLAMYDKGAVFQHPPALAAAVQARESAHERHVDAKPTVAPITDARGPWAWVIGLGLGAIAAGWVVRQLSRPQDRALRAHGP